MSKRVDVEPEMKLPRDEYSESLRQTSNHPEAVVKRTTIDIEDFHGNTVTWVVKTVRIEGEDTVFLQRNDAKGGDRFVLPPRVTAALARHRDGAVTATRRNVGRRIAADRKALGIAPAFLKKVSA